MTEQSSEERRKFEAAVAKSPGFRVFNKEFVLPGVYANPFVQAAWEGWQARAELAVPAEPAPDLICSRCDAPLLKLPLEELKP